jgi:chromosome segregation ATPase
LESLTQTSDNAMERERDAEDRLDAVLSQHARQISQRQSREAELERTIQELGSALAVEQHRRGSDTLGNRNASKQEPGVVLSDVASLRARVDALESDLETSAAHLAHERELVSRLQCHACL